MKTGMAVYMFFPDSSGENVCLFGGYVPLENFSPILRDHQIKGCKFLPVLSTHGH